MFHNKHAIVCIVIVVVVVAIAGLQVKAKHQGERQANPKHNRAKLDVDRSDNEINNNYAQQDDDRIQVAEPYKSLIRLTTRQVLTQANISKHVDVDMAMSVLGEATFVLSKPSNLIKLVEVAMVSAATLMGAFFFFPGAQKHFEMVWHDPGKTLRHLSSGLSERSIHNLLESSVEGVLSHIGLKEEACRLQTICYIGEKLHSKLPPVPQAATRFINNHKIGHSLKDNKYVAAFVAGYGDLDCDAINARADDKNCLVNLMEQSLNHMRQIFSQSMTPSSRPGHVKRFPD